MSSPRRATRRCSRQTCARDAVTTLTYVYSDSTAVIGPLGSHAEPHAYDLCGVHADRLTVPRGWRVLRLELPETWDRGAGSGSGTVRRPRLPAPVGGSGAALRDVSLPRVPAAPRSGARPVSRAAPSPVRGAGTEGHDVPLPESLRRPHLRRPAAGNGPARRGS